MRENALELHGVCKKYGGFALRNVGFTLPRGTVMGLIGENGAGKTTTIKAVLDLIRPDSGEITVLGEHGSNPSVREKIGVVLEDGGFPSAMSAVQVLLSEPRDELLDTCGILRCTADLLDALDPSAVRAKRVGAFGCEALVRRDGIPENWSVEPVNIEQIMLFLTRGEDAR